MNSHSHSHKINTVTGRLLVTMILNFVITIAEVIGGIISGSLALVSDALHNFSDGISVIISYIAVKLKRRDNSYKHTFGLKRAEILAAVINSSVLIVISVYLFYEAVKRLTEPHEIDAGVMILIAGIGLIANVIGTLLLKRDSAESMNIKSSYLHLFSDTVSSVAVILGGLAIYLWNAHWLDTVLTILIGLYIIRESFIILGEAIHVLMEGAPADISIEAIQGEIEKLEGVEDVHHIHLWTVGESDVHLEAHVNVNDMMISQSDKLRSTIEEILRGKFAVQHTTLQFECDQCENKELINNHK